ncbi:hypothetical protein WOLCODRAFT_46155, partial [Wolfiporia cocos MD-104 SS10]
MPPPPKPKPPHKLFMATNSLRNTTFAVKDNKYYFEAVTRYWHSNLTKIIQHDFEVRELTLVAEIEGLQSKAPKVRFGGEKGEWIPASEFVKSDGEKLGGSFTSEQGVEFKWKIENGHLKLVRADDENKELVNFIPYKRHFGFWRMSQRAHLEVKPEPEIMEALDRLIVSFLLVERRRRD